MYIGDVSKAQLISVALMILFMAAATFFIGYKYAYDNAISYANEQIEDSIKEFKVNQRLTNPDLILGNKIEIPNFGGISNEEE